MKWFRTMLFIGTTVGIAITVSRFLRRRNALHSFVKRTEDVVDYSAIPPQVLAVNEFTDLNSAPASEFEQLGLDRESAERVIENRPFRNKVDLLSRKILPDEIYETIKDRIAVSNASDAVKIA